MEPKVSIVVPIYQVEKYLSQCVDSLLDQTLSDIEIILVDDGSPDRCGEIADQYAQKDNRVKVIHQANRGLGPARNSGMQAAKGQYIAFVDSDDWVRPQMCQCLYETAVRNDADIVASGHCDMTEGKVIVSKPHPLAGTVLDRAEDIQKVRKNLFGHAPEDRTVESFPMAVWICIYRRKMIAENQLSFQNILSEDTIFNLSAYACAKVIAFTSDTHYCYRKENQTSITSSFSEGKLLRYRQFLTVLADMARNESDKECIIRAKRMAIDYCRLYVGLVDNSNLSYSEKKEAIRKFACNDEIKKCWNGYPVATLPMQQRMFHIMLMNGQYGVLLWLNALRQFLKKKGWE